MKTSEVPTVCQQLVLTAFKYPNLTETNNGPKKGKNIPPPPGLEPQATRFPVKRHTWCSSRRDGLYLPTLILLLLIDYFYMICIMLIPLFFWPARPLCYR